MDIVKHFFLCVQQAVTHIKIDDETKLSAEEAEPPQLTVHRRVEKLYYIISELDVKANGNRVGPECAVHAFLQLVLQHNAEEKHIGEELDDEPGGKRDRNH